MPDLPTRSKNRRNEGLVAAPEIGACVIFPSPAGCVSPLACSSDATERLERQARRRKTPRAGLAREPGYDALAPAWRDPPARRRREVAARGGYELSKLKDASQQRQLADRAASGDLTHEETGRLVRQHRGNRRGQNRNSRPHTKLCFPTEQGSEVVVSASRKGTYDEIELTQEEACGTTS